MSTMPFLIILSSLALSSWSKAIPARSARIQATVPLSDLPRITTVALSSGRSRVSQSTLSPPRLPLRVTAGMLPAFVTSFILTSWGQR